MEVFTRSVNYLKSLKILQEENHRADEKNMDDMKGHILDSLSAFYQLLFDGDDPKCRIGKDLNRLEMKIFFLAVRRIADMGLNATESSITNKYPDKYGLSYDLSPHVHYLVDKAFPNNNRGNLFGRNWLPLHWALTVQDTLTGDEMNEVMTNECVESVSFVEYVMQKNPAAIRSMNIHEELPLHCSMRNVGKDRCKIFTTLLEAYPEVIDAVDAGDNTLLHHAVVKYTLSIEIVQSLIARRPDLCRSVNSDRELPLHTHLQCYNDVVNEDQLLILDLLVESYRDGLSIANDENLLPINIAAIIRRFDVVEYLLDKYSEGANGTDYFAPVAVNSNMKLTDLVCSKYPNSLQVADNEGHLALHHATYYGYYEQSKLIWATYPDAIATHDNHGYLPMHYICSLVGFELELCDKTELLRFLIKHHPVCLYLAMQAIHPIRCYAPPLLMQPLPIVYCFEPTLTWTWQPIVV